MMKYIFFYLLFLLPHLLRGQSVGIGTNSPDPKAALDINSNSKGLLIPRMTTAQRNSITLPATGLLVYDLDKRAIYIYEGRKWQPILFTTNENKLPLYTQEASDGTSFDYFARSVSIDGDYAIVGAYAKPGPGLNSEQGAAYIFHRDKGVWYEQTKLVASDGTTSDWFGYSVDIYGDYAVVGAFLGGGVFPDQGSVYVFHRSGTSWIQEAELTASDGTNNDAFGSSVAIYGDYIIVGAYFDDITFIDQGSAYIFYRGAGWTSGQPYQSKLVANDGAANDLFGFSVDISGDYAIAGALDDDNVVADQGAAYIYGRIGTSWPQIAKLSGVALAGSEFGYSVSLDGDYAAIGAPFEDIGGVLDKGAVYVFFKGSSWTTGQPYQARLNASDGLASDEFGFSVKISGDYILATSPYADVAGNANQGKGYLYKRQGTGWTMLRKIDDDNGQGGGDFGYSTGINGYNLIIGTPYKNSLKGEVVFLNFE
jgi:hypothetical protein